MLFTPEHLQFRASFRTFLEREVVPHQSRWREAGCVDRDLWRKAGAAGFVCTWLPEEYGGAAADFLYSAITCEELARVYESGFALPLHADVVVP